MEERTDFRRYLGVVLRWWWLILLAMAITGGSGYWYGKAQVPIYEASTKLLIQQTSSSALPTSEDIGVSERLAKTYAIIATTDPVQEGVIQRLNLELSSAALKKSLSVVVISGTPILEFKARSASPGQARDIANTTAEVFIEQNRNRRLSEIARLGAAMAAKGVPQSMDLLRDQLNALGSVEILEPADLPRNPVSPSPSRNLLFTIILGAMLGIAGAFLLEYLNEGVRTEKDLERLGLTCLGIVSKFRHVDNPGGSLIVHNHPKSSAAEAFRVLRTNLYFSLAGKTRKVLMVTSAVPQEGKTTIAVNLSTALAQGGQRVVLMDADLRRPDVHRLFGLDKNVGTSNLLADPNRHTEELLCATDVAGLRVLPSGPRPPNPVELIQSPQMASLLSQLREENDIVLLDSAPVLGLADAIALAPQVDGVVLVVEIGKTKPKEVEMAKASLEKTGASVLGAILNKLEPARRGYYYGYHYHYYRYGDDGQTGAGGQKRWPPKVLGRLFRATKRGHAASKQEQ